MPQSCQIPSGFPHYSVEKKLLPRPAFTSSLIFSISARSVSTSFFRLSICASLSSRMPLGGPKVC